MAFKASTFIIGSLLLCLLTIDTVKSDCDTRDPCTVTCKNNGTKVVPENGECYCNCSAPWTGLDCTQLRPFNYRACADNFVAVIADGVELSHTRKINTSTSALVPQGTKVLGIRAQNTLLGGGWKGEADDGRFPSNTLWRCTTETQLDNRWASEGFDDSSWRLIESRYAKRNYTWMCADYSLGAKWVWVDNYVFKGIIYCRLQLVPTDITAPICAANCLKCRNNGAGKCDPEKCFPGYAFDASSLTCDRKCAQFCARCDINGADKCDPNKCSSSYSYNALTYLCDPIILTACSNDNYMMYADGVFQKGIIKRSASNIKLDFHVPAFTGVLAVKIHNNITSSAGWRAYLSDLSVVSDSSWKCKASVSDENSWKERDFDDSDWPPALISNNIYRPYRVPAVCDAGFPDSAKFLWSDPTFSSFATTYCRRTINW